MILRTVSALEQLPGWSRIWVRVGNFYVPLPCAVVTFPHFFGVFVAMNSSLIACSAVTT
jgi:hypothetical protein